MTIECWGQLDTMVRRLMRLPIPTGKEPQRYEIPQATMITENSSRTGDR